jgi:hypothetical protein
VEVLERALGKAKAAVLRKESAMEMKEGTVYNHTAGRQKPAAIHRRMD